MTRSRKIRLAALLLGGAVLAGSYLPLHLHAAGLYRAFLSESRHVYDGDPFAVEDEEIGFGSNPGGLTLMHLQGSDQRFAAAANPQRIRVQPERRHERIAAADMLAVGCSYTFGYGVEAGEAYPAVAGEVSGYSVANAASSGFGTVGALVMLRRLKELHPRLVIYGFIEAHLERNVSPCAPSVGGICRRQAYVGATDNGPAIIAPRDGFGQWLFVRLLKKHESGWRDGFYGLALMLGRAVANIEAAAASGRSEERGAALAFLLREMKRQTDEIGAQLIVLRIPQSLPGAGAPRDFAPVPDILADALPDGALLIDMAPALAATAPDVSLRLLPINGHPNRAAHRLLGEYLARNLGALAPQ